jgi:hypothetical protein
MTANLMPGKNQNLFRIRIIKGGNACEDQQFTAYFNQPWTRVMGSRNGNMGEACEKTIPFL